MRRDPRQNNNFLPTFSAAPVLHDIPAHLRVFPAVRNWQTSDIPQYFNHVIWEGLYDRANELAGPGNAPSLYEFFTSADFAQFPSNKAFAILLNNIFLQFFMIPGDNLDVPHLNNGNEIQNHNVDLSHRFNMQNLEEMLSNLLNCDIDQIHEYFNLPNQWVGRSWRNIFINRHLNVRMYAIFLLVAYKIIFASFFNNNNPLPAFEQQLLLMGRPANFEGNMNQNNAIFPFSMFRTSYLDFMQNLNYNTYKAIVKRGIRVTRNMQQRQVMMAIPKEMGNIMYWNVNLNELYTENIPFPYVESEFLADPNGLNFFGDKPWQEYHNADLLNLLEIRNTNLINVIGEFLINLIHRIPYARNADYIAQQRIGIVFSFGYRNEITVPLDINQNIEEERYNIDFPFERQANSLPYGAFITVQTNVPLIDLYRVLGIVEPEANFPGQFLNHPVRNVERIKNMLFDYVNHKITEYLVNFFERYLGWVWNDIYNHLQDEGINIIPEDNMVAFILGNYFSPGLLRAGSPLIFPQLISCLSIIGLKFISPAGNRLENVLRELHAFHKNDSGWCDVYKPENFSNCIMGVIRFAWESYFVNNKIRFPFIGTENFYAFFISLLSKNESLKFLEKIEQGLIYDVFKKVNSLLPCKFLIYVFSSHVVLFSNEYEFSNHDVFILLLYDQTIGIISAANFQRLFNYMTFRLNNEEKLGPAPFNRIPSVYDVSKLGEIINRPYMIRGSLPDKGESCYLNEYAIKQLEWANKKKNKKVRKEKKKIEKKILKWGWDIETVIPNKSQSTRYIPWLICIFSEEDEKHFFHGENCVDEFIQFLISLFDDMVKKKNKKESHTIHHFYSFNGSKFDNIFLLPFFCYAFTSYVKIIGSPKNPKMISFGNIFFYDVKLLFGAGSLNSLAKSFLNKEKKNDINIMDYVFDVNKFDANITLIKEYCFTDALLCVLLIQYQNDAIYDIFKSLGKEENFKDFRINQPTLSLLSLQIYRNLFPPLNNIVGTLNNDIYLKEKASYKGGMCLPIKKLLNNGTLFYYDINSSYPNIMKNNMFPIKFLYEKNYNDWVYLPKSFVKEHDLYLVQFRFKSSMKIPFLPIRVNLKGINGLIYPLSNEDFDGGNGHWFWGKELLKAYNYLDLIPGTNKGFLLVRKEIHYLADVCFDIYIEYLYKERIKAKKDKNEPKSTYLKLLMNSLYGKFGQKRFPETEIMHINKLNEFLVDVHDVNDSIHNYKIQNARLEKYFKKIDVFFEIEDDDKSVPFLIVEKPEISDLNYIGSLVRISSFVACCARVNLFTGMETVGLDNVYYFDTDSIFSSKPLPSTMVGDQLGKWKLECDNIVEALFLAPKVYAYRVKGEEWKKKCKGIPANKLKIEDFFDLLNKNFFEMENINQIHRVNNIEMMYKEITKVIRIADNKRLYDKNGDSKPYLNLKQILNIA